MAVVRGLTLPRQSSAQRASDGYCASNAISESESLASTTGYRRVANPSRLTPEAASGVVKVGLGVAGLPPLIPTTLDETPQDLNVEPAGSGVFEMPPLGGSWARCSEGLDHPHTGVRRPVTFDQSIAAGRDDLVLVHLSHRLTEMCQRLLRSEVWAQPGQRRLHRISARVIGDDRFDEPLVIAHARLIVQGQRGHRLHEELIRAGGAVRQGRFRRLNVGQIDTALGESEPILPRESMLDDLREVWPRVEAPLMQSVEARANDRMQFLTNTLDRRRDEEIGEIRAVLTDLEAAIKAELQAPPRLQLTLWEDEEREQLGRNKHALELRVDSIPGEIEKESESIRSRYSNRVVRTFPVAVTFVVPRSMA